MFARSYPEIKTEKSSDFAKFLIENAKNKTFWEKNKETAFREVDGDEINLLFSKENCRR